MILRVFPENVTPLWPQFATLLQPLLAQRETHSAEDVRLAVMSGRAHLWMQWREPVVEAALVTEFAVYPRGAWLRVWLDAAAPGIRQDTKAVVAELDKWRIAHGCCGWEVVGRPAWARLFPQARVEGLAMRWTV